MSKLIEVTVTQDDYELATVKTDGKHEDEYPFALKCRDCLVGIALQRVTGEDWWVQTDWCRRYGKATRYPLPPKAQELVRKFDAQEHIELPVTFVLEVD